MRAAEPRPATASLRTGGEILADALRLHGAEMLFAVCGESFLPLLDAVHERPELRLVNCRHEAGAAVMAEAQGKLSGRPGVCLVSRGPGACHAAIGLHTAFQDSTPMLMLVGQVPRAYLEREAQQEIDYRRMLAPLVKWVAQIDQCERIPEMVHRAFRTARSGRPGPVVLVLPEDVLEERIGIADCGPAPLPRAYPAPQELATLRDLLSRAERPVMIVGGSLWSDRACADVAQFAEAHQLPVCCSYRRLDLVASDHPCFAGELSVSANPELIRNVRCADLVLAVGTRLSEPTTQDYTLLDAPVPSVPLVHIYPAAEEIGRVYQPALAIQADLNAFAEAAVAMRPMHAARDQWLSVLRQAFLNDSEPAPSSRHFDPGRGMALLRERLAPNAIVTLDAGAFAGWPQRFLRHGRPRRLLAPVSGAMNYGLHAGIAASLAQPDRQVLVCVGDGGFVMGEAELATAKRHGGRPTVLLFNNGLFGSVRIHQERRYPGRPIGTDLTNPDFAMLTSSYGCHAEVVEHTEDFLPAWDRAQASGLPAVLELRIDAEQLSSRVTLDSLRSS